MKITRRQLKQLIKEEMRKPKEWKYDYLVDEHGADEHGVPKLTINISDDNVWTLGPSPGAPYTYGDIITDVPDHIK